MESTRRGRPRNAGGLSRSGSLLAALYWCTPVAIAILQSSISRASAHQIRFEEIAESIRNVYWLDHRLIYDGISSNVGWYGTLLVVYKLFGFTLVTAKWVRLGIFVAGLFAAAALIRRVVPLPAAFLPLLSVGLSPTLLYFNAQQTSFGLDVPYAALALWILLTINASSSIGVNAMRAGAAGFVAMLAALSYPSFLLFLPSLLLVGWSRLATVAPAMEKRAAIVAGALVGAAAPLAAAFAFVSNRSLLYFDPATRTGVFRGGGHLGLSAAAFRDWLSTLGSDLFVRTDSYHAEISSPEFAGVIGVISILVIAGLAIHRTIASPENRRLMLPVWLLLATTLIVPGLSVGGPPGLRRATAIVAVTAALLTLLWRASPGRNVRGALLAASALLVGDHALKVPALMDDVASISQFRDVQWYARRETPSASLADVIEQTANGRLLSCPIDEGQRIRPCRYQDIFPAVAGTREWGGQGARAIEAVDWRTGQRIVLTPRLWTTNYYPH